MDSRFKIFHKGCTLSLYGLEQNGDEYMYEDEYDVSPSYQQYKYSESITLNAVYSVTSDNKYTLEFTEVIPHDERIDQSDYLCRKDGLFELHHLILPTKKFIDNLYKWPDLIDMYSVIYYYNEDDCLFYKYNHNKNDESVSINLILEVNDSESSVLRSCQIAFNICYLEKCIYNISKQTIQNYWGKCIKNPKFSDSNRDLIWMGIYVIKYLIELEQFNEAQRILETITDCGGLCYSMSNNYNNECGCS